MTTSTLRLTRLALLVAASVCIWPAAAQPQPATAPASAEPMKPELPTASGGGKAVLLAPRPVVERDDPLNQAVAAQTVDGMVLVITIDGAVVGLDSATPARVPKRQARSSREGAGDVVKATAFAGGLTLSTTVVPDTVLNASEGGGLVRTERRQISLVLAADRPIETVSIVALATGANATLDVRSAYARICEADRSNKWCAGNSQQAQ